MKYIAYRENAAHGTLDFPIAYYAVDDTHPRYEMTLHWYPEYEIIRVQSGRFHLNLDGRRFTMEAGDAVLISEGMCHSGVPEDCVYECLVLDLQRFVAQNRIRIRQVLDILNHKQVVRPLLPRDAEGLYEQLDQLFVAMKEERAGYELFVQGSLFLLLGMIVRDSLCGPAKDMPRRNRKQQMSLKNAVLYMEEHYAGPITLDELARCAGMNRKYFCSFFRSMTQKTPMEYLNNLRVEMAAERLVHTDHTVAEIAGECGFNDVSYFTKVFRRYMEYTPLSYRKKHGHSSR